MSLLDDVSIVVTPNGVKASKLYAVIPSNGDADMDVTRATDATRVDEDGLIADVLSGVPRIDYTGGGCPHILAEPERKNEVNYSEDFTDSSWVKTNVDVSNNTELAPNGTETATRAIISSTGTDLRTQCNVIESTNYTFTFYAKKGTSTDITYRVYDVSNGSNIVSPTNYFSQVGIDWQRVELNFTTPSGCTSVLVYLSSDSAVVGDIYLWGVQLEKSYATSYIPTSGSTVTRNQDIFTRDGIGSLINDSEGVLFSEVYFEQTGLTNGLFAISDGTFNNILMVRYSPINKLQIESTGGVNIIESSARPSGTYKIAVKYDSNGVELWVDGNKISETSTQSTMSGINELMLGKSPYGNIVGCKVKQLQVYNTALTDEQLLQLTGTSGTDFYESYAEMASALTYTIQ